MNDTRPQSIDAHQHYWEWSRFDYGPLFSGLPALARDFLPPELEPELTAAAVKRSVTVQVLHTLDETRWMLALADRTQSIAGVVGWVDLTASQGDIARDVEELRRHPRFVGIRHLIHEEPDVD